MSSVQRKFRLRGLGLCLRNEIFFFLSFFCLYIILIVLTCRKSVRDRLHSIETAKPGMGVGVMKHSLVHEIAG